MHDVLLVTVDALRADRAGYVGVDRAPAVDRERDRDTTPRLDAFAEDAGTVSYTRAHAHGPSTYTSFPSILTGTHALSNPSYPHLGDRDRVGPTVIERFAEAGYHTMYATSNVWISPTYGYDRGVDAVHILGQGPRAADSWWDHARHRIGDAIGDGRLFTALKTAYDRVRTTADDGRTEEDHLHELAVDHLDRPDPTFTWIHLMTAHAPYTPDPGGPAFLDATPDPERVDALVDRAREAAGTLDADERALLVDAYDEAVRHADRRVGDLVDRASTEALVAVGADHGEELFDHGDFEHPPRLNQELLHVPLAIAPPGDPDGSGELIDDPVGLEALPETLVGLATGSAPDAALPPWGTAGAPVVSACAHPSRFDPEAAAREHLRVAVREGDLKYRREPDGSERLFDLAADPGETAPLDDPDSDVRDRLADRADAFARACEFGDADREREHAPEVEQRLQDLGYAE